MAKEMSAKQRWLGVERERKRESLKRNQRRNKMAEKKVKSEKILKKQLEKKDQKPVGFDVGKADAEKMKRSGISTESALQEQLENIELQKFDLLEKLNILKWNQRNMARVWKIQKSQMFKKLNRLDNNIAVFRKDIKEMEVKKMPENDEKPEGAEETTAAETDETKKDTSAEESKDTKGSTEESTKKSD